MGKIKGALKQNNNVYVKYVKVAKMYCRTHWDTTGKQIQEWQSEEFK